MSWQKSYRRIALDLDWYAFYPVGFYDNPCINPANKTSASCTHSCLELQSMNSNMNVFDNISDSSMLLWRLCLCVVLQSIVVPSLMLQHYFDSVRALPLEDQESQFFDPVALDCISQDPVFCWWLTMETFYHWRAHDAGKKGHDIFLMIFIRVTYNHYDYHHCSLPL